MDRESSSLERFSPVVEMQGWRSDARLTRCDPAQPLGLTRRIVQAYPIARRPNVYYTVRVDATTNWDKGTDTVTLTTLSISWQ